MVSLTLHYKEITMNTTEPILPELNKRKSVIAFSSKAIEQEKLDALWAAAQWSPSSYNKQEWHYYAVTGDARRHFTEILVPGNHWAVRAPLLLAVTRDGSIDNTTESRPYGMYDVALSVMCLVVEAEHQGLRAHQMSGFHDEPFQRLLGIPENEIPVVVVAVGYEGTAEDLPPEFQSRPHRPRTRKPLDQVVTVIAK